MAASAASLASRLILSAREMASLVLRIDSSAASLAAFTTASARLTASCDVSLAVSAMFVLLMSGLILYETSNIIHGGETNYIMATVTLFVAIFNLFTSLLHLLGFMNSNE